ncbi:MAG: hypothetical protein QOI74_2014 [Micromonosporaceae bacterium]|jgi:hypothetical protein|nr:hypothetical protein [Micromonosporaceae bacterium]
MTAPEVAVRGRLSRVILGVPILIALTVVTWWLWLGRDTTYQTDPVTGAATGPYEAWQVVGCVLSLAAIAVVGGWVLPPWAVVAAMTVSFTVAWSWAAAVTDDTGLWLVGAVLVAVGLAAGSAALSFGARAVRALIGRR